MFDGIESTTTLPAAQALSRPLPAGMIAASNFSPRSILCSAGSGCGLDCGLSPSHIPNGDQHDEIASSIVFLDVPSVTRTSRTEAEDAFPFILASPSESRIAMSASSPASAPPSRPASAPRLLMRHSTPSWSSHQEIRESLLTINMKG